MINHLLTVITTLPVDSLLKLVQNRAAEAIGCGSWKISQGASVNPIRNLCTLISFKSRKIISKDFDAITSAELWASEIILQTLGLNLPKVFGHQHKLASNVVQIDHRRVLQSARPSGGEVVHPPRHRTKILRLNLMVFYDISGSMTNCGRMMICFIHSMSQLLGTILGCCVWFYF